MPTEPIDERLFAPCGMNCMVCYRHCSHKKPCAGCRAGEEGKPAHCRSCKIKDCIREKSLSFCYECGDFPCRPIRNLDKSYRLRYGVSLLENSRAASECGLPAFLREQQSAFTCPVCGGIISLHDAACSDCGRPYPVEHD